MSPVIVGVIVAAGASTRMGFPKQLLPVAGRPMLQWAIDAAEASALDQVVVVTGYAAEEVRAGLHSDRAIWVHNPDPDRGTMSSLRAGVRAAGPHDAVMKLVSDQPEVTTGVIDALIESWDPASHSVLLARYREGDGHPVVIARPVLAEVIDDEGDRLVWKLIERDADAVARLDVHRPMPLDVNTPDDARLAEARLGYDPSSAGPPRA